MKAAMTCAALTTLITFGSGAPASLTAFAGMPFYINTTTGDFWVATGTSFSQVDLSA